jgi:defect in organelle trafficking protein DotD
VLITGLSLGEFPHMLKKAKFTLFAVGVVALLSGCASNKQTEHEVSDVYGDHSVDRQIAESVERVAKATETLARVQVARTAPTPSALDETNLPEELKRPATIDWSGPAHLAAEKVAKLIGYQFKLTGNPPSVPPMINVSVQDVSAAKALEDIGLQAFPFGEVAVDPNVKRVEFRYLQAQQQPVKPSGTSPAWGK